MAQATSGRYQPRQDGQFAVNLNELLSHYRRTMPDRAMRQMEHAIRTIGVRRLRDMDRALRVGDAAPDVMLKCVADTDASDADASRGSPAVRLADLLEQGPVVLKFYRGRWCPYCTLELRAWQRSLARLDRLDGQMIAVSPQNREQTRLTRRRDGLTMGLVSDAGNHIARQFGVAYDLLADECRLLQALGVDLGAVNSPAPDCNGGPWSLPVPALYLIARGGRIAYRFVDVDFRNRAEPQAVLDALSGLEAPAAGRAG
jgi:peroxiredoxin